MRSASCMAPQQAWKSEEAVLLRGPEPTHEAEAIIAALRRVAGKI